MNARVALIKVMKCCVCVFGLKIPISSISNKKKTVAFQIVVCLMNWGEIWARKNSLINEKTQKEHCTRTVKTYRFFSGFSKVEKSKFKYL